MDNFDATSSERDRSTVNRGPAPMPMPIGDGQPADAFGKAPPDAREGLRTYAFDESLVSVQSGEPGPSERLVTLLRKHGATLECGSEDRHLIKSAADALGGLRRRLDEERRNGRELTRVILEARAESARLMKHIELGRLALTVPPPTVGATAKAS